MFEKSRASRRLSRRRLLAAGLGAVAISPSLRTLAEDSVSGPKAAKKWPVGHHFWNWDQTWTDLDKRLQLTKETGYLGFEAKPEEIGTSAEALRRKCDALGVRCVALGAGPATGIDYLHAAGGEVLRCSVSVEETEKWVAYAAERGIILAVHPHIGRGGVGTGSIETREDMLRYLDARPGVFGCPDTGHLLLCGSDPVQTILDLGERCRYIHLKDIRPEMVGGKTRSGEKFCDIGTGALDLAGVLDALGKIDYDGWIMVESNNRDKDHVQSARSMRKVLGGFGL